MLDVGWKGEEKLPVINSLKLDNRIVELRNEEQLENELENFEGRK
jgi:hypothetical protein